METVASKKIFVAVIGIAMITVTLSVLAGAKSEEYTLFVSVDETKVTLISGNFSVFITRDWPRVIFKHEVDPFSPHFEIGFPRMYLHNDSDCDGMYEEGEASLAVFLDSNHVRWNFTSIDQGFTEEFGEFASFGMRSSLNAYRVGENETLVKPAWANMTFWFFIAELPVQYENVRGSYVVDGETQLRMNFSLSFNDDVDTSHLVLEQFLQGGGSTNTFHLFETADDGQIEVNDALATIDERLLGSNYSHRFNCTTDPMQKIQFAKEDGVVQAFYAWGSDVLVEASCNCSAHGVNASYYTTGNGMMLHSILPLGNLTAAMSQDYSVGIHESGFVGSVRDWLKEESSVALLVATVAVAVGVTVLSWRRRHRDTDTDDPDDGED